MTELGDDECGGGAGTKAEDHARLHILNSLVSCQLLEVILGEDWSREGLDAIGFVGGGA